MKNLSRGEPLEWVVLTANTFAIPELRMVYLLAGVAVGFASYREQTRGSTFLRKAGQNGDRT